MHVKKLEISNFMRIVALTVDADGNHVSITGPNASGKTSAVNCLWAILGGAPSRDMPEPITTGAEQAVCRLDLGEYIVEKKWTKVGTRLDMWARDGSKIRRPQEILDGLLGRYSLDPVAFLMRKPAEQVSDVLRVMGISPPIDQVKEITGEVIEAFEGETADKYLRRLVGDRVGIYYVRRTDKNRIVDEKKKAHDEATQAMLDMGGPPTAEEIGADATELHHQLQAVYAERDWFQKVKGETSLAESKVRTAKAERDGDGRLRGNEKIRIEEIDKEIDRLKKEREICINHVGIWDEKIASDDTAVASAQQVHKESLDRLAKLADPAERIHELNERITQANQQTEKNAKRQQSADHCNRLQDELAEAMENAEGLDRIIAEIRDVGMRLLGGIDLGINGLIVGDGELRLNNISFQQASHAEKLRVACAVGMRENPTLKVLRCDDGEHLDAESRRLLFEIADEHGYQVFITAVSNSEDIKVEIIDGETTTPAVGDGSADKKKRASKKRAA